MFNHKPTKFDLVVANTLLGRLRDGETLKSICKDELMPSTNTVWEWNNGGLSAPTSFSNDYARARLDQADGFVGDIFEIADSIDEAAIEAGTKAVMRLGKDASSTEKRRAFFFAKKRSIEAAREQIDVRKWAAARMHPSRWGDKVQLEHTGVVDVKTKIDMSAIPTEKLEEIAALEQKLELTSGLADAREERIIDVEYVSSEDQQQMEEIEVRISA